MLLTLLLQAPPPASPMPAWLGYVGLFSLIISLLSIGLNVVLALRKENREDGQTVTQRLKKLEAAGRDTETRMTGFQQQHERAAETFTNRCNELDRLVAKVPALSESIVRMETRLEENGKTVERMDRKMDRILEALGKS